MEDDESFETTPVLRQTRYDSLDLTEITMRGLGRSQTPGAVQRSSVYEVNELSLLRSSARLFIRTNYLGRTVDQVRADLQKLPKRSTVDR